MQSYSFYPNYAKFFRNVRFSCCLHRVEASVDNHGKRNAVALAVHARYLDYDLLMELHGVERRGHEAFAELRDVHKTVLVDANVDEGTNINEWTKATRCWDALKTKLNNQGSTSAFPKDVLAASSDQETEINEAQQAVITQAGDIDADVWFSINKWGKEHDGLTPVEVSFIGNFAYMIKRGRPYTYKQAKWALSIYEKAENAGWHE